MRMRARAAPATCGSHTVTRGGSGRAATAPHAPRERGAEAAVERAAVGTHRRAGGWEKALWRLPAVARAPYSERGREGEGGKVPRRPPVGPAAALAETAGARPAGRRLELARGADLLVALARALVEMIRWAASCCGAGGGDGGLGGGGGRLRRAAALPALASAGAHHAGNGSRRGRDGSKARGGLPEVCYFPGAGAFFFWQLGFAQELEARCARKHLRTTRLIGCSAGALVAALATAEVSPQRALDLAAKLSIDNGIKLGSAYGITNLGGILHEWLEELLPEDAGERLSGRCGIVVRDVRSRKSYIVTHYSSKQDVIDALAASVHIPLLSRGKPAYDFRGRPCADACFFDPREGLTDAIASSLGVRDAAAARDSMWECTFSLDVRNKAYKALSLPTKEEATTWMGWGRESAAAHLNKQGGAVRNSRDEADWLSKAVFRVSIAGAGALGSLARALVTVDEWCGNGRRRRTERERQRSLKRETSSTHVAKAGDVDGAGDAPAASA